MKPYTLNIINMPHRTDRKVSAYREIKEQCIIDYEFRLGIKTQFNFNGVRRAHQNVVMMAKQKELPYVIIAEDDIKFLGKEAWLYYFRNMPKDFDLYLGGIMSGDIEDGVVKGSFSGLTLYTVHKRFYDTFLSIQSTGHLDRLLADKGRYVVCDPMVVSQHGGYSDNHEKVIESYDKRLINRKLFK